MPQVRKLTDQEVQQLNNKGKGTRKLVEEEYDAILSEYGDGDYGEATLSPGENRLTVRNRLKAAAKRHGVGIDFRRTSGDFLRFKIVSSSNANGNATAAGPAIFIPEPDAAPAKRKGGRPKKTPA